MKKSLILLAACSAALVSCGKMGEDGLYSRASGEEVVFSLSKTTSKSVTKSQYSGDIQDGMERIDWVEGEQLSIACLQTINKFFDYTVTSIVTDGYESKAKVSHDSSESGLKWNEDGEYHFYAVSPALSTLIPAGYAIFNLPISQGQDLSRSGWNSSHTNYMSAISPSYMHMTAKQTVTKSGDAPADPVNLSFMMLPTVLEFTLSGEADMSITQVGLESSSTPLTGQYQVYINEKESDARPDYPRTVIQDQRLVYKSASISLSDGTEGHVDVNAEAEESVTFTFMLLPKDIKDLTFFLTREDESGNPYTVKTKLSYADGTALEFDAHKKYLIKGMIVPESIKWKINGEPLVTSWDSGVEEEIELTEPDCVPGLFTVSAGDDGIAGTDDDVKVHFSMGNLYWDGTTAPGAYKFEANQYDYRHVYGNASDEAVIKGIRTETPENTVGGLCWVWNGDTVNIPYDNSNYIREGTKDWTFVFTNEASNTPNPNFTVNGVTGKYRCLASYELMYMLEQRVVNGGTGRDYTYSLGIDYGETDGMVIYPDDYIGEIISGAVTTLPDGVVFLPMFLHNNGYYLSDIEYHGWGCPYYLFFNDFYINPNDGDENPVIRNFYRLVIDAK